MAKQNEVLDLEKIFPSGSWVTVSPNITYSKNATNAYSMRSMTRGIDHFAGKTVQVSSIHLGMGLVGISDGSHHAYASPDWLIRTDAPKAAPQKNAAYEQFVNESKRADARRDNNLREVFGFAVPPPVDFQTDEVCLISEDATTASGKAHQFAGRKVVVKNVYRNKSGMWAANVERAGMFTRMGRNGQSVSVLMNFMKKL